MALPAGELKHKIMAVVLHDEFGYTQASIASLMGVSPSSISSWISVGRLIIQNQRLENEVVKLKEELGRIGYNPHKELSSDIFEVID